jgi:hypothetical protein
MASAPLAARDTVSVPLAVMSAAERTVAARTRRPRRTVAGCVVVRVVVRATARTGVDLAADRSSVAARQMNHMAAVLAAAGVRGRTDHSLIGAGRAAEAGSFARAAAADLRVNCRTECTAGPGSVDRKGAAGADPGSDRVPGCFGTSGRYSAALAARVVDTTQEGLGRCS